MMRSLSDGVVMCEPLCEFEIQGVGKVFVVDNPIECDDFAHLVGRGVIIGGNVYTVKGVERFTHSPPWMKGEKIGLLVVT